MAKDSKDASICSLHPAFGFGVTDGKRGDRSSLKGTPCGQPCRGGNSAKAMGR